MSSKCFLWAQLNPKDKLLWPVIQCGPSRKVYCHSDDAIFELNEQCTILPFDDIEKWKATGSRVLRKKPATFAAFLADITWAEEGDCDGARWKGEVVQECHSSPTVDDEYDGDDELVECHLSDIDLSDHVLDPNYVPNEADGYDSTVDDVSKCRVESICNEDNFVSNSESESSDSVVYPALRPADFVLPVVNSLSDDHNESDSDTCVISYDGGSIARDILNKDVFVTLVQKSDFSKTGKRKKSNRVYNSRHPCLFCNKIVTNFSHHILAKKHQEEDVVKELLEEDKKERKKHLTKLRLKAAHDHNLVVLKEKKGEIFLLRRSLEKKGDHSDESSGEENQLQHNTVDIGKYGPCPQCFGWVTLKSINRHVPSCVINKQTSSTKGALILQSNILCGKISVCASTSLREQVFPIMQLDNISEIAKNDSLIVNLGNQWMMKNRGNEIMRKYYTSSIMRLAAKLKLAIQALDKTTKDMDEYLRPCNFENIVKGALQCSKQDGMDEEDLQSPSNCIKLGYDLKRMLSAKLAKAIMNGDEVKKKEAEDFLKLMQMEWGLRVTQLARQLLKDRAFNREIKLPRPDDIKKLANYLKEEIGHLNMEDYSYPNYRRTAVLSLTRITLFNRRRCHEVQAMRISSYSARKTGVNEITAEMRGELTMFETQLLERQELVVIRGKWEKLTNLQIDKDGFQGGRGVPVILPLDVKEALKFLADSEIRQKAGLQHSSPYLFANRQAGVFRAYDAIRNIAREAAAGLDMPDLVRTSNMRKYMATMLQALDTTEAERQWVIDHLGHSMDVHRVHYRQTSDLLERVDIAKILLIQDMGLVGKYRGKKLQDIQLNDIFVENGDGKEHTEGEIVENRPVEEEVEDAPGDTSIDETFIPEIPGRELEEEEYEEISPKPTRKQAKQGTRKRWSTEEVTEIENLFRANLQKNACPGQKTVEKMMRISHQKNGFIHLRERNTIKTKISNMLITRRKCNAAL